MQNIFEEWLKNQFSEFNQSLLSKVDGVYVDDMINAMWIGFSAHAELTNK